MVDTSQMKASGGVATKPPSPPAVPPSEPFAKKASSATDATATNATTTAAPTPVSVAAPSTQDKSLSEREHRKIDELFSQLDEDFGESVARMDSARKVREPSPTDVVDGSVFISLS